MSDEKERIFELEELIIEKVKARAHVPLSRDMLNHAKFEFVAQLVANDFIHAFMSLWAPGTRREVADHEVWVAEVPDGRWQMFKAALGLPHRTRDVYKPTKTIYYVCPHEKTHTDWLRENHEEAGGDP